MYKLPLQLLTHYVIILLISTIVMPIYVFNKELNITHFFNNFIIFDVLYYLFFAKLIFTNNE